MGEAKRKAEANVSYIRLFGIFFKPGHRLEGKLVRVQRQAAMYFTRDEAELIQVNNDLEEHTVIDDVCVKRIPKMLKPGAVRNPPPPRPKPKAEVEETPAMKAAKEQLAREKAFAKFLADPSFIKTPEALDRFEKEAEGFSDKAYWRFLGMLFCGCSNHADRIEQWRRLFRAKRPNRTHNLMTDAERKMYRDVPATIAGWRAHRAEGEDWLTFGVNESQKLETCKQAAALGVIRVTEYRLRRDDIEAVFLRRGWLEVVVLDPAAAERLGDVPLLPVATEDAPKSDPQ